MDKSATEVIAERSDAWKIARSLLRGSDLPQYGPRDVLILAEWLLEGAEFSGGDDDE